MRNYGRHIEKIKKIGKERYYVCWLRKVTRLRRIIDVVYRRDKRPQDKHRYDLVVKLEMRIEHAIRNNKLVIDPATDYLEQIAMFYKQ